MTAVIPGPKSFQQLVFKAVTNRKRSGYVDCQRGQIDELWFERPKVRAPLVLAPPV